MSAAISITHAQDSHPDLIFGLIVEHRRLWGVCNTASSDDEADRMSRAEVACLDKILATIPTTHAGLAAYIDHIESDCGFRDSRVEEYRFDVIMRTVKRFATAGAQAV